MKLMHSPANILRKYLIGAGQVQLPTSGTPTWPAAVGNLPPAPDQMICIYDTSGKTDGRIHSTGETQEKFGFQIRVRVPTYDPGWEKAGILSGLLDTTNKATVTLGTKNYLIHSVTITSPILYLGQEEGKTRQSFTLNGLLTITEILP